MRRSLSGLYQEMLLQCIPKLWKLRILVIKFWQCFYRLKCIFWSFVYFFTNFRSFFFFAWQYVWFLLFPRQCYMCSPIRAPAIKLWSRDHLHPGFRCAEKDNVKSLLWLFVCKSIMSHHTQIDLILFIFSRVVFLPMVSEWRGVFCTDEILFLNSTKIITF